MAKSQGALASDSGNILEQTVKTVFQNKGFKITTYREWEKIQNCTVLNCYLSMHHIQPFTVILAVLNSWLNLKNMILKYALNANGNNLPVPLMKSCLIFISIVSNQRLKIILS